MNLNHLRWALEVERTGSFTAAANSLFVAQSNLSTGIKALEAEIGFSIFIRKTRGIEVTPQGKAFLEQARQAVYHLDGLESSFEKRNFTFAVHRHCTFIADAVSKVINSHRDERVRFHIKECGEPDLLDSVFSGESMFGVAYSLSEADKAFQRHLLARNLSRDVFLEGELRALVRRGHPLAERGEINVMDLAPFPSVMFSENESRNSPFSAQAKEIGGDLSEVDTYITVDDRATLYELLVKCDAVWLTCLISRTDLERYGLTLIPVGKLIRSYSIITPNSVPLPKLGLELVGEIKDAAKRLLL